ncbi:MAG TPA: DEAD/DEAH box helicase, partial [Saprospiraceae bacterium]|nr:DEAD/DEAH box helicase [Saprospiraceae bacterium]
ILLEGKDLLGCAQTGTGKTAAFTLPIIQHLQRQNNNGTIKALILTPTRELAIQIDESIATYGSNTKLKHTVIFGGVNQHSQVNILKKGVDILVATPGRLLDLIGQGYIHLNNISHFVLDEADRMLDMGFVHDVKKIIKLLPTQRQTLLFSATMPESIQQLASSVLKDPVKVEVTPVSSTAETVTQKLYHVDQVNKGSLLLYLLGDKKIELALVFTRTKHGADKIVKILNKNNITAEAIHGNKSQNARQKALLNFKEKTTRVLVATDIAARGIDIDDLEFVVNFELPNIPETYVHRIGRTGRAGANGMAVSFCSIDERPFLKDIQKLIGKEIPTENDHPYPSVETEMSSKAPKTSIKSYSDSNSRNGSSNDARSRKPSGGRNEETKVKSGTSKKRWFRGARASSNA